MGGGTFGTHFPLRSCTGREWGQRDYGRALSLILQVCAYADRLLPEERPALARRRARLEKKQGRPGVSL
jgi:hypothetical protein